MHQIREIAQGVYQISTYDEKRGISFNQYLIDDEKAALISTGSVQMFDGITGCIQQVRDPSHIDLFIIPHFESDECGALAKFLEISQGARVVCAPVCARQLIAFGMCLQPVVVNEYDLVGLGDKRLRFIYAPWEMHLWDGLMAFEERKKILFTSDLFGQMGEEGDEIERAVSMSLNSIPTRDKLLRTLEKIEGLDVEIMAPGLW